MIVKEAKEIARQWIHEEGNKIPGFAGAFYHGSTNWLPEDADLPPTSDLDIMVMIDGALPANKLGKFVYRGVLLEVSYLSGRELLSAEQVLGQYHLAGSFHTPSVIADPTGKLTTLQQEVSANYARYPWVYKRCEHARSKVLGMLDGLNANTPFHQQVTTWLFANGVTTHILLVAGLKNPTVRRRYQDVRALLSDYGRLDFYEELLAMLGCATMSQEQIAQHLVPLTHAFDEAKTVIKTPYAFAADISDTGRAVAIGGSQELIENGFPREAIFWMVATYARCLTVLSADAPLAIQETHNRGFRALVAALGITSFADIERRAEQTRQFLPRIWEVAEGIMPVESRPSSSVLLSSG